MKKYLFNISLMIIVYILSACNQKEQDNKDVNVNKKNVEIINLNMERKSTGNEQTENNLNGLVNNHLLENDDYLFYIEHKEMTIISKENNETVSKIDFQITKSRNIEEITLYQEHFYSIENDYSMMIDVHSSPNRYLVEYNQEGEKIKEYDISEIKLSVINIKMKDNKSYILEGDNTNHLYIFDISQEKLIPVNLNNITMFDFYEEDKLIFAYYRADDMLISIYDIQTDTIVSEVITSQNFSKDLIYEPNQGKIYFCNNGDISVFDLKTNTWEKLYHFMKEDVFLLVTDISLYQNNLSILFSDGSLQIFKDINNSWDFGSTLNVLVYGIIRTIDIYETEIAMNKLYPNFQLNFININHGEYSSTLAKKLMAGDKDFDLFIINDDGSNGVIKSGYFDDLAQYPKINDNINGMLYGIKSLLTYQDKIIGVPTQFMDIRVFNYDLDILNYYQIKEPKVLGTLKDYLDIFEVSKDKLQEDHMKIGDINFFNIFNIYCSNFFNGEETEKDNLKHILNITKDLYTMKSEGEFQTGLFKYDIISYNNKRGYLTIPKYKETAKYPVSCEMLAINPNGENKKMAVEFLEIYSSKELQEKAISKLIKVENNASDPDYVPSPSDENNIGHKYFYERDTMKDNDNYQLYKQILENSICMFQSSELNVYAKSIFDKYIADEIDLDTTTDTIYSKMLMMKDE